MTSANVCVEGGPPSWCDHSRSGGKCDVCKANGGCCWEDACVGRGCRDLRDGKVTSDGTPLCLAGGGTVSTDIGLEVGSVSTTQPADGPTDQQPDPIGA